MRSNVLYNAQLDILSIKPTSSCILLYEESGAIRREKKDQLAVKIPNARVEQAYWKTSYWTCLKLTRRAITTHEFAGKVSFHLKLASFENGKVHTSSQNDLKLIDNIGVAQSYLEDHNVVGH